MKKIFTILFCLIGIMASADEMKLALLQPRVADGSAPCKPIELNMVRGELRKAFGWQSDFQVLTRTDVDEMLKEQDFQRTGMVNDAQRQQVGIMTGAQYICVSTITKEGTQLYIESYLVNVETGQMTNPATQFANIQNNDYSMLQEPCNELAKEMLGGLYENSRQHAKGNGVTQSPSPAPIPSPSTLSQTSSSSSNRIIEYVDLGLPSGTLWKNTNEDNIYTYTDAMAKFGNNLPTKKQMEELIKSCKWKWTGNGYTVVGPNGKSIELPVENIRLFDDRPMFGNNGVYWLVDKKNMVLLFDEKWKGLFALGKSQLFREVSVRLVR